MDTTYPLSRKSLDAEFILPFQQDVRHKMKKRKSRKAITYKTDSTTLAEDHHNSQILRIDQQLRNN